MFPVSEVHTLENKMNYHWINERLYMMHIFCVYTALPMTNTKKVTQHIIVLYNKWDRLKNFCVCKVSSSVD
jgi:hypothetical protein